MTEWEQFAKELAEQLAALPVGTIMTIIAMGSRNRFSFVQFAIDEYLLVAESTSDACLAPVGHRLPKGRDTTLSVPTGNYPIPIIPIIAGSSSCGRSPRPSATRWQLWLSPDSGTVSAFPIRRPWFTTRGTGTTAIGL
ncbi:hypothetical protein [Nocardia sp. NPDC004604]|uniref:TY-Chap domain-containing protein n=1 Tax=Nocardia sp. NPDC004604 TaxID=3157013 RepID=UPI0033A2503B